MAAAESLFSQDNLADTLRNPCSSALLSFYSVVICGRMNSLPGRIG